MESRGDDEDDVAVIPGCKRRPLYTIRQPPLIQPLRQSDFTRKACSDLGILADDLAHEWVTLFQALVGGVNGEGMTLQIPDTVLLSPSGHPSVWYATSSAGRIKSRDMMRVAPQAILKAFQTPLPRCPRPGIDDVIAIRRLGFETDPLSSQQLKACCRDMEHPSINLPLEAESPHHHGGGRQALTKGVFCLQQYIPNLENARFLVVWRHSSVLPCASSLDNKCTPRSRLRSPPKECNGHRSSVTHNQRTPRAHSDVFLLTHDGIDNSGLMDRDAGPTGRHLASGFEHLDIDRSESCAWKTLRRYKFDPDVMTPLLFYMRRVTSDIANSINREHNTRQTCGLACEFFVGAHNQVVYFSALLGIQWAGRPPSWELLSNVHPISRFIVEFYNDTANSKVRFGENRKQDASPRKPCVTKGVDKYYEQNPRFPSVSTPFATTEKQWLHRSQMLAPDISPRYVGAAVPKIYRDGEFRPLLSAYQADSVVRLSLSPQAPSSLAEVHRHQPHLSPRSALTCRASTDTSITIKSGSQSPPSHPSTTQRITDAGSK